MRKYNKLLLVALATGTIFFGCKKNQTESVTPQPSSKTVSEDYASLIKQGVDTTGIKDLGKYYLIEGDILVEKSSLPTIGRIKPNQAIESTSQLISNTKISSPITIRIDGSVPTNGGKFDWRTEVSQAISEYNALANTDLRFTLVTTATADITIVLSANYPGTSYVMPSNTIAAAGLPSGGNPFNTVAINSGFTSFTASSGQKKYNLAHELGHCIGFRHTNWSGLGEPGPIVGVGSSPNSGSNPDAYSVYNGNTAGNSWNTFSTWDKYAVSYLYPKVVPLINGSSSYTIYPGDPASRFTPSGTITARPGALVTVTTIINVPSSVTAFYSVSCNLPNTTYTDGNHSMSRSGQQSNVYYSDTKTFIMPASGNTAWNGNIALGSSPSGAYAKISVQ